MIKTRARAVESRKSARTAVAMSGLEEGIERMIKLYSKINCGLGPAMQKLGRGFSVPVKLWNLISMI